jgi:O-antigen ligase
MGNSLAGYLFGLKYDPLGRIEVDPEQFIRPLQGILVSFLGLVGSSYMYSKHGGNRYYLLLMFLSFLSIWITATRGWLIASFVVLLPFLTKINRKQFANLFLISLLMLLLLTQVDVINRQFYASRDRFLTLEQMLEGDITAGGTVSRTTTRHEKVWNKFLENPILGWGYLPEASDFSDGHVGNQNLLLRVGIIGYLFFLLFIFSPIKEMLNIGLNNSRLRFTSSTIAFSVIAIFIIHSTSRQMFGLGGDFTSQFSIAFIYTLANHLYYNRNGLAVHLSQQRGN